MAAEYDVRGALLAHLAAADRPLTIAELVARTGLHQTTVADRLRILRVDGLVARSGRGTRMDPYRWVVRVR